MDKISRTFTIQANWKEIQYNRTEVSEGLDSLVSCELIWVEDTTSETFVIQKSVEYCIPPKNRKHRNVFKDRTYNMVASNLQQKSQSPASLDLNCTLQQKSLGDTGSRKVQNSS